MKPSSQETSHTPPPDKQEDITLPRFIPSWKAFYGIVILNFFLLILLFLGFQAYFK